MNSKLIILSGPSGSGKSTLAKHLIDTIPELEFSVSACSREKRNNEIEGKDYYFISVDEFRKKIENDEFIEWEEVYKDQYYGTLKSEVDRIAIRNHHVIFDIDVIGGLKIKELFAEKALSIIIIPPSANVLEERLKNRKTEDEANLKKRLEKSKKEMEFAALFDLTIINDNLEESKKEIEKKITEFLSQ